jgi:hypothetical protein
LSFTLKSATSVYGKSEFVVCAIHLHKSVALLNFLPNQKKT